MRSISDVFRLAGWTTADPLAEKDLQDVERRLKLKLPSEFRKLMALENGPAFLAKFSNGDLPIEARALATPLARYADCDPLAEGLLPFIIENQGVCVWAIRLSDPDDPEVFVEVDDGHWRKCADSLTGWLECQVRDRLLLDGAWFAAQGPKLTEVNIRRLREQFNETLQTYSWPGKTNYRFANSRSELLLWDADSQCDWWIRPTHEDQVRAALDEIDEIAEIRTHIYKVKEQGRGTLESWRCARGAR